MRTAQESCNLCKPPVTCIQPHADLWLTALGLGLQGHASDHGPMHDAAAGRERQCPQLNSSSPSMWRPNRGGGFLPTCMIMSQTVVLPLAVPPATPMKKGWACMRLTPPIDLFLTEPALRIELSSSSKGSVSERSPVRGTGIGVDGEEIETLRALAW